MNSKYTNEPTHKVVFKKLGMSQYFENGALIPVTLLEYQPMKVFKKGNYYSLAFIPNVGPKLSKSNKGQLIKNNLQNDLKKGKFIQLRGKLLSVNDEDIVELSNFSEGDLVDVQGTTKGKGFSGVMKRYNFKGGRASHGASLTHRTMGSTGCQDIGHVDKGKKMPGRHGNETRTTHNLNIMSVDLESNIIAVKGSVPGVSKGLVFVRHAIKLCKNQNPWKKNPLALADLKGSK